MTPLAATPPKATVVPKTNPSPVTVTVPPPPTGPADGEIEVTAGAPAANWSTTEVGDVPIALATVMSTPPSKVVGDEATIIVGDHTATMVAGVAPKSTVSPRRSRCP